MLTTTALLCWRQSRSVLKARLCGSLMGIVVFSVFFFLERSIKEMICQWKSLVASRAQSGRLIMDMDYRGEWDIKTLNYRQTSQPLLSPKHLLLLDVADCIPRLTDKSDPHGEGSAINTEILQNVVSHETQDGEAWPIACMIDLQKDTESGQTLNYFNFKWIFTWLYRSIYHVFFFS